MNRERKLIKNTFILSIGTFLPRLTSFIILPILTGCLTKNEYGSYDLITILASLYLPAITLQIQTAAFRFLIDERNNKQCVKKIVSSIVAFTIIVSLIGVSVLYIVLYKYDLVLRLLICIYYLIDIINSTLLQISRGLSFNLQYSISALMDAIFQVVFIILLVYILRLGIYGAVLTLIIAAGVSIFILLIKTKIYKYCSIDKISKKVIKDLIQYSWPMVPNNMSMWVMRVSDRFVLTFFLGPSANAIYAVANKIPNILSQVQNTFTMAWQENASIFSKDSDIESYYSSMFRVIYDFMAGVLGLLIAVTPVVFDILIKGDYREAYVQMPILFCGMFFSCMSSYLGGIYVAYKKTKSVGLTTFLAAISNIVIDLLLILKINIFAASISTMVSYIFLFVFRIIDIRKIVKLEYNAIHMICVIAIFVMECALNYQQNMVWDVLNLILASLVFVILNLDLLKKVWLYVKNKIKGV